MFNLLVGEYKVIDESAQTINDADGSIVSKLILHAIATIIH